MVLAARREGGRHEALVEADRRDQYGPHFFGPAFSSSSSSSDLTPARPSRSANSAASERATTTKSWPAGRSSSDCQKASLSSRFTLLRSTAPPTLRPTESPSRGGSSSPSRGKK